MLVVLGQGEGALLLEGGLVEAALEDRVHGTVGDPADAERPIRSGFEALGGVLLAEPHETEASPVALLGMGPTLHDAAGELGGARAGLLGPRHDARGRPFEVLLVCLGPVAGLGRVATLLVPERVGGDASAAVQDLDRGGRDAGVDLLTREGVGHAVVVSVDVDVVVDVDAGFPPAPKLVALRRQRQESGPLQRLEQRAPVALELLEGAVVERVQQPADLPVQLGQAEEGVLAEPGQNPALDDEYAPLDLRLVTRWVRVGSTTVP